MLQQSDVYGQCTNIDVTRKNKLLNKLSQAFYVQFGQRWVFLIAVCEHSKAAAGRLEKP